MKAQRYLNKALELFENGFKNKSQKNEAMKLLNSIYYDKRRIVSEFILGLRENDIELHDEEKLSEIYWAIPFNLHQFKNKHSEMLCEIGLSELANEIKELADLREQFKEAEVKPRQNTLKKHEELLVEVESLADYQAKLRFLNNIIENNNLKDLHISLNRVQCVNQFGTIFIRNLYYLNGRVIPLNELIYIISNVEEKA